MANPKVSVIIPVYNTGKYLEEALSSILNQTLSDIEIVVINDGSTDGSGEIIDQLALNDARIRLFSQQNQGQSVARNLGKEKASGDFIYFMDSDDYLEKDALEKCYEKCITQNLQIVFFDATIFSDDEKGEKWGYNYNRAGDIDVRVYSGVEILEILLEKELFRAPPWLFFVKRELIQNADLRFFPGIIHEDELFTPLLYIAAERVGYIPRTFFHRRIRANSTMTNSFSQKNINGYFCVIGEFSKLYKKSDNRVNAIFDHISRNIVNSVAYQASSLQLRERLYVFCFFLREGFIKFTSLKNLIILFFPFTITIKSKIFRPFLKKIKILTKQSNGFH